MSADEKGLVEKLGTKLKGGDTWYVVEQQWFERFCAYLRVDPMTLQKAHSAAAGPAPGRIVNTSLLDHTKHGELRRTVTEGVDFSYVHSDVWSVVSEKYGFDFAIPRAVALVGLRKMERIELHPVFLSIYYPDATGEAEKKSVKPVSAYLKLKDLITENCPNEEKTEGRMWRDSTNWRLMTATDMEMTVEAAEFADSSVLLEYQKDGKWPRAHKEEAKRAWNDFKIDDVIDAKDTEGKWYESRIIDVKDDKVYVHYNGWASRWDEWLAKDSPRLAPKGTHSVPRVVGYGSSSYSWGGHDTTKPKCRGAVGLRNLGNTCFMNSTIQCLSNTPELTEFFISKKYIKELNRTNPLGWGGKIAEAYAGLLEDIWGDQYSVVSPAGLKQSIGEFQPRFSGYQQHDSSELLSFLLDGLHEDLNRVLKKPATTAVDSKGREDDVVAKESWERHLLRNQSVIVDKFQGQLKSKVVCPDCKRESVTFDPFMFLSIPLPQSGSEKTQRVTLVRLASHQTPPTTYAVPISSPCTTRELLKNLCNMVQGLQVDSLVMAEVYTGVLYKKFKSREFVDRIAARDEIYVYELPTNSHGTEEGGDTNMNVDAGTGYRHLQLVHWFHGQHYPEKFGLPMILALPEEKLEHFPLQDLRQIVADAISPFVDFQGDGYPNYYDIKISGEYGNDRLLSRADGATHINLKPSSVYSSAVYSGFDTSVGLVWTAEGKQHYRAPEIQKHESAAITVMDEDSNGARASLGECMAEFTKEETLAEGDEWYCSACKGHKKAKKQFSIFSTPEILIIHLKRFSYNRYWRDKIGTLVDFTIDGLDMSQWVVSKGAKKPIYDLYAVSNHYGGLGGGHYTAFGRNCVDNRWYDYNDSSVSPLSDPNQVKTAAAYVLFYRRRD